MKSSYTLADTPGAEGIEIEFRALEPIEILGQFPELLDGAFPDAGQTQSVGASRARQRALEQAGLARATDGIDSRMKSVCAVINRACSDLQVHATWAEVPRGPDGAPLEGHLYHGQLGADVIGLYAAILDSSKVGVNRLEPVRQFLQNRDLATSLDILGRRYRTAPSEMLGVPRSEPGSYVLDVYAAQLGEQVLPEWGKKK